MLVKLLQMFSTCLTTFKDVKLQNINWFRCDDVGVGLTIDINEGLVGDQAWGVFSKIRSYPYTSWQLGIRPT